LLFFIIYIICPCILLRSYSSDVFVGEDQLNQEFLIVSRREAETKEAESADFFFLKMTFLCLMYYGIKFILYAFLFWTPFYLTTQLNYTYELSADSFFLVLSFFKFVLQILTSRQAASGYISIAFDIGGFVGSIANGIFSDRIHDHRLLALSVGCFLCAFCIAIFFVLGRYVF
jgi:MFS family permease